MWGRTGRRHTSWPSSVLSAQSCRGRVDDHRPAACANSLSEACGATGAPKFEDLRLVVLNLRRMWFADHRRSRLKDNGRRRTLSCGVLPGSEDNTCNIG